MKLLLLFEEVVVIVVEGVIILTVVFIAIVCDTKFFFRCVPLRANKRLTASECSNNNKLLTAQ